MSSKGPAAEQPAKPLETEGLRAVPLEELTPDAANARTHSRRNLEAIRDSIRRFGQRQPLVVQEQGMVVRAGNARLLAMRELGMSSAMCLILDEDDAQAVAYAIADNRTAELAEWDEGVLARVLESLPDVDAVGFTQAEIQRLIDSARSPQEAPEPIAPPENPETNPGDLYDLGEHRLLCGDATSPDDLGRLLDGAKPGLLVTDPPYGVEYDPAWRAEEAAKGNLAYAPGRVGDVQHDDRADWSVVWAAAPCLVAYCWHAGRVASVVQVSLEDAGFEVRSQLIWSKPHMPISRGHYHWRHEPCWYAVRKGATASWCGDRKQSTIWDVPLDQNDPGGHGTQKPVELMARPMRNHDIHEVLDPFVGSGTTLVAAEQIGRRCFAMEISPAYCDVTVDRWQRMTGKEAKRCPAESRT